MNLNELIVPPEPQQLSDTDIELRSFDDSNVSPEMAELLGHLSACTSINQLRTVLSVYLPELGDGSVE